MGKKYITLGAFVFWNLCSFAQNTLTGFVINREENNPLELANVILYQDSTMLSGTTTDKRGHFRIELQENPGMCILQISCIGYNTERLPVIFGKGHIEIGNILLTPKNHEQKEAVATATPIRRPDRLLVYPTTQQVKFSGNGIDLLLRLQLSRNFLKDGSDFGFLIVRIFADVIAVKSQYVALHLIHLFKISCFHIFQYSLRHSSDNQVLPEIVHCPAVESLHRKAFVKPHPDVRHQHFIPHRPQELLKVHRKHFNGMFLGRQHDVLDILLDGNKRTCFNVVITPVCHQVLDGCAGTGAELHFVEYDQGTGFLAFRLAGSKFPPEVKFQIHEKHIEVVQIKVEKLHYLRIYPAEVHQKVRLVFFACKFFHDIAFSDTPGSFYQKGCITLMVLLPFQQFIVYLPSHDSRIQGYYSISIFTYSRLLHLQMYTFSWIRKDFRMLLFQLSL